MEINIRQKFYVVFSSMVDKLDRLIVHEIPETFKCLSILEASRSKINMAESTAEVIGHFRTLSDPLVPRQMAGPRGVRKSSSDYIITCGVSMYCISHFSAEMFLLGGHTRVYDPGRAAESP